MKKVRKALFFLVLILSVPIFNKGIQIVQSSVWDGEHHINIAISQGNGDLHIWSVEPPEKKLSLIIIPGSTYLIVLSYGRYKASVIDKLSLLERRDASLFQEALTKTLGVPIDGIIIRKKDFIKEDGQGDDSIDVQNYFGGGGLIETLKNQPLRSRITNLTIYDFIRLWLLSFRVKSESIKIFNVADSDIVSKTEFEDRAEITVFDSEGFSKFAGKYFLDKKLKEERLTIEVINGTERVGEANSIGMLLSNIGSTVIATTRGERRENTVVYTQKDSYTASKIAKIVQGELKHEEIRDSRADITVVIGEDR